MSKWSLSDLLGGLHDDIQQRLATARKTLAHPGAKGTASENVWLELLQTYLPHRYQAAAAHVVDSQGVFSEQIDVVIFDRQYSPLTGNFPRVNRRSCMKNAVLFGRHVKGSKRVIAISGRDCGGSVTDNPT